MTTEQAEYLIAKNTLLAIMKDHGLIQDYETEYDYKNFSVDQSGKLCFDLIVTHKVIPNIPAKNITVPIVFKSIIK